MKTRSPYPRKRPQSWAGHACHLCGHSHLEERADNWAGRVDVICMGCGYYVVIYTLSTGELYSVWDPRANAAFHNDPSKREGKWCDAAELAFEDFEAFDKEALGLSEPVVTRTDKAVTRYFPGYTPDYERTERLVNESRTEWFNRIAR